MAGGKDCHNPQPQLRTAAREVVEIGYTLTTDENGLSKREKVSHEGEKVRDKVFKLPALEANHWQIKSPI